MRIKNQVSLYNDRTNSVIYDGISYDIFPLLDAGGDVNVNLSGEYVGAFVSALKRIMENCIAGSPTYFHCWQGSDRTGSMAWALLTLLGVAEADKSRDYEITNLSRREGRDRDGSSYVGINNYFKDLGDANDNVLDGLLYWCGRCGISANLVNAYRRSMIDGNPSKVTFKNNITRRLANCTMVNLSTKVESGAVFTSAITPNQNCTFSSIKIYMGDKDITDECYSDGLISIPEITADVTITAVAVTSTTSFNVQYIMDSVQYTGTVAAVTIGRSFTTTLSANGSKVNAAVIMGLDDITESAFNANTGVVSISKVTGNIVIAASKNEESTDDKPVNLLKIAVNADGTPFNSGQGWKAGYRLNSSGEEVERAKIYVTGYMPVKVGQTITLKGINLLAFANDNFEYIAAYRSDFSLIKSSYSYYLYAEERNVPKSADSTGMYIDTLTLNIGRSSTDLTEMAYIRFSANLITENSEVYASY